MYFVRNGTMAPAASVRLTCDRKRARTMCLGLILCKIVGQLPTLIDSSRLKRLEGSIVNELYKTMGCSAALSMQG